MSIKPKIELSLIITIGEIDKNVMTRMHKIFPNVIHEPIPFVDAQSEEVWQEHIRNNGSLAGIGVGAAGCLIAHRLAWQLLSKSKYEYALILESDAMFAFRGERNFRSAVRYFKMHKLNILHLGNHEAKDVCNIKNTWKYITLRRVFFQLYFASVGKFAPLNVVRNKFYYSTHAYLISQVFADELLKNKANFLLPIDELLSGISSTKKNKVASVRSKILIQNKKNLSQVSRLGR
jgi:GR25 family glycosyltransferase involved in LPS biosynthesis